MSSRLRSIRVAFHTAATTATSQPPSSHSGTLPMNMLTEFGDAEVEVPGAVSGEQIVDLMLSVLSDGLDHPELWEVIPGLAEERLQLVAEVFGTTAEEAGGPGDIQGHLGARYRVGEDLVLDAAIGRSFTARPPVEFFATVGLTWTFDAPWKRRMSPQSSR